MTRLPSDTPLFVPPCIFLYEITVLIGEIVFYGQALEFQEIMEGSLCTNLDRKSLKIEGSHSSRAIISTYEQDKGESCGIWLFVPEKCPLLMLKSSLHAILTSLRFTATCVFLFMLGLM